MSKKSYETITDTVGDLLGMFAVVFSGVVAIDVLTPGNDSIVDLL